MLKFGCREQQAGRRQFLQDDRIRFLTEGPRPGGFLRHFPLGIHQLDKRQIILASHVGVVLTESRGDMDHAGTVGQGYIAVTGYIKCLFMLFFTGFHRTVKQRFIFLIFQILTHIGFQHLIGGNLRIFLVQIAQDRIQQRLRHIIGISVRRFYFHILFFGVYAKSHVGGQGPGGGGPCQDISILSFYLKTGDRRAFLHVLVALGHLMGGQGRTAAGAVRHDFKALVKKAFIPDFFQRPPFRLDIFIMVGYVRIIHIRPEADLPGKILPHALIFPYALFTFLNERGDSVLFNLFLAVQAQKLLHLQLHRKSVGIPAGLSGNHIPLHGTVTGNHILDGTGFHVADMRFPVCGGRSVIKGISRAALPDFHTFFKYFVVFPELFHLVFPFHEVQICIYLGVK